MIPAVHSRLYVCGLKSAAVFGKAACLLAILTIATGCGGNGENNASSPAPTPPSSVTVLVSPSNSSVLVGNSQQFTAVVSGSSNQAVTWSVNGVSGGNSVIGTISAAGLYTAPGDLPRSAVVTIAATSQASSSTSGNSSVTITSDIAVGVATNPSGVSSVTVGATVQLASTISSAGHPDTSVTWSVDGIPSGNSSVGIITPTVAGGAKYVTPAKALLPVVSLAATSVADPSRSASLTLGVNGSVLAMQVAPTTLSFSSQSVGTQSAGQTIVVTNTGNGPLTISSLAASGVNSADFLAFNNCPGSAGSLAAGAKCTVNVTFKPSVAASENAALAITSNAPTSPLKIGLSGSGVGQGIAIIPGQTTVLTNFSVPLIQTVTGLSNTAVSWSVNGVLGGESNVGTISTGGIYTAPVAVPNPPTVTVEVASQTNPALSASAAITVVAPTVSVSISPSSATVQTGLTENLTALVAGANQTGVNWFVNGVAGGNNSVGTITLGNSGGTVATYTAPSSVPGSSPVTVTATSVADPSASASATFTVTSSPLLAITSLDKTALAPFGLLTISGIGFDPGASIIVTFTDNSGFSVATLPVEVTATSLEVPVPPHFDPSSGNSGAANVSIQVVQTTVGDVPVASNSVPGFEIQDLPMTSSPPGTVTLDFLHGVSDFIPALQSLLVKQPLLGESQLNTTEMMGALQAEQQSINALLAQISNVAGNPGQTFNLVAGSGTVITVGSADLARMDRVILGMLDALAASSFDPSTDDQPGCAAEQSGLARLELGLEKGPTNSGQEEQFLADYPTCPRVQSTVSSLKIAGGVVGVGLGILGVLGLPAELTAAGTAGVMIFTAASVVALASAAGYLGQGTPAGQEAMQGAADQLDRFIQSPLKKLFGTLLNQTAPALGKAYNLYNLASNALGLHHALTNSEPYSGGPSGGTTQTLNVSVTGGGQGTVTSFPGGIVCGSNAFACSAMFPTGDTVFLTGQPAIGSVLQSFTPPCLGACQLSMSVDQSALADFELIPPPSNPTVFSGTISGSNVDEGHGGCNAGEGGTATMSGTITMNVSPAPSGGFSFTGTANLSQGAGICDDYSGSFQFSGEVPSLDGGITSFSFGDAFATGTFNGGNAFSGSWSFSTNVGPDVANGTISLAKQ